LEISRESKKNAEIEYVLYFDFFISVIRDFLYIKGIFDEYRQAEPIFLVFSSTFSS